MNQPR
jgi:hypothetical protein